MISQTTQHQALVSVIMPTFNRAHVISSAIKSITDQTSQNWELVIVDDGSTDNTQEVVDRYAAEDPRIRYIKCKNNLGVSAARNQGLHEAHGQYIAYLDSDNYLYGDWLETMLNYFEQHPSTSWLYPRLNTSIVDRRGDTAITLSQSIIPQGECAIEDLWSFKFQADPNGLIHRVSLIKRGNIQWDENIKAYGDYDYALQLSQIDIPGFRVHPFVLGRYVRIYGMNGLCSNRDYPEIIAGLRYLQTKHASFKPWVNLNDIEDRIKRYTSCYERGMKPIDGLREKFKVPA